MTMLLDLITIVIVVVVIFILFPFLVFLIMKTGTYGYYKGRSLWKRDETHHQGRNNESS